jgi:hypothetical protein
MCSAALSDRQNAIAAAFGRKRSDFSSLLTILGTAMPALSASLSRKLLEADRDDESAAALREFGALVHAWADEQKAKGKSNDRERDAEIELLRNRMSELTKQNEYGTPCVAQCTVLCVRCLCADRLSSVC